MSLSSVEKFYCVYLLNSLQHKGSTYIGSTNDPARRLRQHDGIISKGACQTKKSANRPWEMALFVHGFPTKAMALKFEHAWQHCYQSRFTKIKHVEWKMKKSNNRGMLLKINALKLLLNNEHFAQFDLEVVVFNTDGLNTIKDIWDQKKKSKFEYNDFNFLYCKQLNIQENHAENMEELNKDETVLSEENFQMISSFYQKKIQEIDHLRENILNKQTDNENVCFMCSKAIETDPILCYHEKCHFKSHFMCIYTKILHEENESLVPKSVYNCFNCKNDINWFTLQKVLYI